MKRTRMRRMYFLHLKENRDKDKKGVSDGASFLFKRRQVYKSFMICRDSFLEFLKMPLYYFKEALMK